MANLQEMQGRIRGLESKMYFAIFFMFVAVMASMIYNTAISIYTVDQATGGQGFNVFRVRTSEEVPGHKAPPKLIIAEPATLQPTDQGDNSNVIIVVFISIFALGSGGWLSWKKAGERKIRKLEKIAEAKYAEAQKKMDISKWNIFKNIKYKFEMKYPDTWQISRSDDNGFEATDKKNIIAVSIIDFRAHPNMTFQGWLNRHLDSMTKIGGRDALRWSTGNKPIFSDELKGASEHFIMPHDSKEFAVEIDMNVKNMDTYGECIQMFGLIISTFRFID